MSFLPCEIFGEGDLELKLEDGVTFHCSYSFRWECGAKNGEYRVYFLDGNVGICGPDDTNCPLDRNTNQRQNIQVFCDPCFNKCSTDGRQLKYSGSKRWLFMNYVNSAPEPTPIPIKTYIVNWTGDKLIVNDQECCCGVNGPMYLPRVKKTISLKQLIASTPQISIPSFGGDPNTACGCGGTGSWTVPDRYACTGGSFSTWSMRSWVDYWRGIESDKCS